ncbi:hypothetical protein ACFPU1_00955 [Thalassorhabdus alkalitolerans]|uniref:DUF4440 domain-containing protein n=2 Tax=Bacillaceae TaxID=186817 RepID=A0ABW0YI40_9BACI
MKRKLPFSPHLVPIAAGLVILVLLAAALLPSDARKAAKTVEEFYELEQEAKFASSWELFHSSMQEHFPRDSYISDRPHVFQNHFDVEDYEFTMSSPEKIKEWRMFADSEPLEEVYEIVVTKSYVGKYGHFDFVQFVYVTEEEREWRILWDYKE